MGYDYDDAGVITNIVYPGGVDVGYVLDDADRLQAFTYSINDTPFIERVFQRDDLLPTKLMP